MRAGIICTFHGMAYPFLVFWNKPLKKFCNVSLDAWIIILVEQDRCAGVWDEQRTHSFFHTPSADARLNGFCKGVQSLPGSSDFDCLFMPLHVHLECFLKFNLNHAIKKRISHYSLKNHYNSLVQEYRFSFRLWRISHGIHSAHP